MNKKYPENYISSLENGQWDAIKNLLDHSQIEKSSLHYVLASGQWKAEYADCSAPLFPDYFLLRQLRHKTPIADRLYQAAKDAADQQDATAELSLYRAALAFAPTHEPASLALAWSEYARGCLKEALDYAQRAFQDDYARTDAATAAAWMLWENGDAEKACLILSRLLDRPPESSVAHWYLGYIFSRTGRLSEAKQHLRRAMFLAPQDDEITTTLAWVLADLGRLDEALDLAWRTIQKSPTPHRFLQLGRLLMQKGEYQAALLLLRKAEQDLPNDPPIQTAIAGCLLNNGDPQAALSVVDACLMNQPNERHLTLQKATILRRMGETHNAVQLALRLTQRWPDWADGWVFLGDMHQESKDLNKAWDCFVKAEALDPSLVSVPIKRAKVLSALGRPEDALPLLTYTLSLVPDRADVRKQLALTLIEMDQGAEARPHLHRLLQQTPLSGELWAALSAALYQTQRLLTAKLASRRARRFAPDNTEVLQQAAALELASGDLHTASELCHRLLQLCPNLSAVHVLAARTHLAAGRVPPAERHAEQATTLSPKDGEAWYCLGQVRLRQNQLTEAEESLLNAHALAPQRSSVLEDLATLLVADDRLSEALIALQKACEIAPKTISHQRKKAEVLALAGRFSEAISIARQIQEKSSPQEDADSLLSRLLLEQGIATPDQQNDSWADAVHIAADALYCNRRHQEAALTAIRLKAAGAVGGADLVRLLPDDAHRHILRQHLQTISHFGNGQEVMRSIKAARQTFANNAEIDLAALYLQVISGQGDLDLVMPALRHWQLKHGMQWGQQLAKPRFNAIPGRRLHVAYLASSYQAALLDGVLAAHDPSIVTVHLYTDHSEAVGADVRRHVLVHPLAEVDLAASCAANGIDVVIDTVGLHPFHGQDEVLRFLRRRIAPLQCSWLGTWGPTAGISDLLISDSTIIPTDTAQDYAEDILRLDGGQWCWTPPSSSPDVCSLPADRIKRITFGCVVRGPRISPQCLESWAGIVAALPDSRLMFIGPAARDWELRASIAQIFQKHGLSTDRTIYQFQETAGESLAPFASIDILLDTFPANDGQTALNALWMGVPVVTLVKAERGLACQRQGASVLSAIGANDWIAQTESDYQRIALTLAASTANLSDIRGTLRNRVRTSPLLEGRRIAKQLEAAWLSARHDIDDTASATDLKSRCQIIARRQFAAWKTRGQTLALPQADTEAPDVSVVIVLFNQAGLSLQTLRALADQDGVSFETIIVDNASTDDTSDLLDRIKGATILRNTENIGFLLAANQGAAQARGKNILFLNNDANLHPGALAQAVERLASDPAIGVVGGRIVLVDGSLQEAGCLVFQDGSTAGYGRGDSPERPEYRFVRDVDYVSGAFLMIRHPLWLALDGFDTGLAPAYYEDADLCLRVLKAGFRVVYDPEIVLTHVEGGSTVTSDAASAMILRNRQPFCQRHADMLAERSDPLTAHLLKDRWATRKAPHILALDNGVPHMAGGAGNPRARLMLQGLAECHVTFFPLWFTDTDWRSVYQTLPDNIEVMIHDHASTLERFLEERRSLYDVMLVSRPPNMAIVDEIRQRRPHLFQGIRIVYDAEALFAARDIVEAAVKGSPMPRAEAKEKLKAELDLAAKTDAVLAVSKREARLFRAGGAPSVHVLSHAMTINETPPGREGRNGFLFMGALTPNSPNEDSLIWLVEQVLPKLAAKMNGQSPSVTIIGECRSARIAALASDTVRLVGRVEDPTPWYDGAAVFVAPTRFAAGIPLKVIEAACAGIPVVATPLLVRQLGWENGKHIISAKEAEDFASAMADLHNRSDLWTRIQKAAGKKVMEDNAPDLFLATLRAAVLPGDAS